MSLKLTPGNYLLTVGPGDGHRAWRVTEHAVGVKPIFPTERAVLFFLFMVLNAAADGEKAQAIAELGGP